MNRDELVEMVREVIAEAASCGEPECKTCTQAARAALAIIEPAVREACALEADGAGCGRAGTLIAAAIRAGDGE